MSARVGPLITADGRAPRSAAVMVVPPRWAWLLGSPWPGPGGRVPEADAMALAEGVKVEAAVVAGHGHAENPVPARGAVLTC